MPNPLRTPRAPGLPDASTITEPLSHAACTHHVPTGNKIRERSPTPGSNLVGWRQCGEKRPPRQPQSVSARPQIDVPLTPEWHQPPFQTSPCLNGDSCSASLNASANSVQSREPLLFTSAAAKRASISCGASGMFQFASAWRTSFLSRRPLRSWVEIGVGWGRGSGQDQGCGQGLVRSGIGGQGWS